MSKAAETPERTAARLWDDVPERLRSHGLRWTPQRRNLIDVLRSMEGHVTATDLIARCRETDPTTTPSTVYRILDLLEELGLVQHCHGADGREEYHVLPEREHGHLVCSGCGGTWEIRGDEAAAIVGRFDQERGFEVDLSHVTIVGHCAGCRVDGGGERHEHEHERHEHAPHERGRA